MTQQIIDNIAKTHGISSIRAMVVLYEILSIKKDSALTESRKTDMVADFSINDLSW